jgi:regulator of nucleoside diphosphate kinase
MNRRNEILITRFDRDRLNDLLLKSTIASKANPNMKDLSGEIRRARIVDSRSISPDYVTMNSTFELRNLGEPETHTFTLVFPDEADLSRGKISILAPIGTAVLGYKVGDIIKWQVPSGEKCLQISKIIYQPEASGDYHL